MVINGYDYKFLYSVGAYLAIQAAKFPPKPTAGEQAKILFSMALIMSKEYEDAQALHNDCYVKHPLTPEVLKALPVKEFQQLVDEVTAAMADGSERTVEAESSAKKNGAVRQ